MKMLGQSCELLFDCVNSKSRDTAPTVCIYTDLPCNLPFSSDGMGNSFASSLFLLLQFTSLSKKLWSYVSACMCVCVCGVCACTHVHAQLLICYRFSKFIMHILVMDLRHTRKNENAGSFHCVFCILIVLGTNCVVVVQNYPLTLLHVF